ncbi:hypothetical protein [Borreliella turdi]|uniref:hypothetical protein n=1 Tax=Borreliella turdi TaxID=57863 RepID=UPI0015627ECD|nr:hypothetical protein [Borreliella turdi]
MIIAKHTAYWSWGFFAGKSLEKLGEIVHFQRIKVLDLAVNVWDFFVKCCDIQDNL